ncbi:MAG TPA: choice-of-anchor tandem repeat GloVer-containing protein [Acidobacteriaceae bacterium]
MAIKVQFLDLWARWLSPRLRPAVAKLNVGIILFVAATAAWSQTQFPYTVLYKFPLAGPGQFQQSATGNLALDSLGSIYGATTYGGPGLGNCFSGCGVAFKLSHGRYTNLDIFHSYPPSVPPSPWAPSSGLLRDKAGNLYGETQSGGSGLFGTVYTIDPNGNETVLAPFDNNERNPVGGLMQDKAGDLLGVTQGNCIFGRGCGEIFKVDLAGNKTVLYTFPAGGLAGSNPQSALVVDKEGNIYGTTFFGGANLQLCQFDVANSGCGVLFKLSPDGTVTVLHNFTGMADGGGPGGLAIDGLGT